MKANISWITEQVATGGDLSFDADKAMEQMMDLLAQDIDLIIDCRLEANDEDVWEGLVDYLHLPVDDYGFDLPQEHFDAAVEAARPVLAGGGKVFVHCHMGINRGPSTAYAILLDQRMSATRAFDLIREARPQAGIVFAESALKAHLNRRGNVASVERMRRLGALRRHIDAVMTPAARARIQRIIRGEHERDRLELGFR